MDVRVNGSGYQVSAPPPGSGEFAPAPVQQVEVSAPAPAAVAEVRAGSAERQESSDALQRAVSEINSSLAQHARHLSIRHHEATNRRVVTVYNSVTNEVVREIPPESVLDAHASMLEMVGIFVNTRG